MSAQNTSSQDACNTSDASEMFDTAMKLIGDFWTLRIIDVMRLQELRFGEIERALNCCNPVTLTNRLKKLEEAGVLRRTTETRDKQSVTYSLTAKGQGILPVLEAIKAYTREYATTE